METNLNKKHKNSVFSILFSNPETLRELYSAIEGIDIPPDIPIEINTLSNVLIKGKLNDISFLIDNRLVVLIEHQSTINQNMPFRMLQYISNVYQIITNLKQLYREKLIKIPTPEFIVLYNGDAPYPERKELRLSDAFMNIESLKKPENGYFPLELIVQVYNINNGFNSKILESSKTLWNYSFFIGKIKEYRKNLPLDESVKRAIKYCINNNILRKFLESNSSEVFNMLFGDWDLDIAKEVWQEEAREDGWEAGIEKGLSEGKFLEKLAIARNLLNEGSASEFVEKITGLDLDTIQKIKY